MVFIYRSIFPRTKTTSHAKRKTVTRPKRHDADPQGEGIARDVGIPLELFDAGGAAAVLKAACDLMGFNPKKGMT